MPWAERSKPMENLVVVVILVLILGGAAFYIYKAKKSGAKCIGCPDAKTCGGNCGSCGGNCSGCGHK